MNKIIAWFRAEPAAAYVTALGAIVAVVIAWRHLDSTQAGYLTAIATGLGTIITAVLARPAHWAVIGGAAGVILQALVIFHLHLSSAQTAAFVTIVNLALGGLVMRPQLTPTVRSAVVSEHARM